MAIKIDLEKAYDKLEWSFIRNMLLRINLLGDLIDLIMSWCFYGVHLNSFKWCIVRANSFIKGN